MFELRIGGESQEVRFEVHISYRPVILRIVTLGFDASDRPANACGAVAAEEVSALPDDRGASVPVLHMHADWVPHILSIFMIKELHQLSNMTSSLPQLLIERSFHISLMIDTRTRIWRLISHLDSHTRSLNP